MAIDFSSLAGTFLSGSQGKPQPEFYQAYGLAKGETQRRRNEALSPILALEKGSLERTNAHAYWADKLNNYARDAYQFSVTSDQAERQMRETERHSRATEQYNKAMLQQTVEAASRNRETLLANMDMANDEAAKRAMAGDQLMKILGISRVPYSGQEQATGEIAQRALEYRQIMGDGVAEEVGVDEVAGNLGISPMTVAAARAMAITNPEEGLKLVAAAQKEAASSAAADMSGLFIQMSESARANGISEAELSEAMSAVSMMKPGDAGKEGLRIMGNWAAEGAARKGLGSLATSLGATDEEYNIASEPGNKDEAKRVAQTAVKRVRRYANLLSGISSAVAGPNQAIFNKFLTEAQKGDPNKAVGSFSVNEYGANSSYEGSNILDLFGGGTKGGFNYFASTIVGANGDAVSYVIHSPKRLSQEAFASINAEVMAHRAKAGTMMGKLTFSGTAIPRDEDASSGPEEYSVVGASAFNVRSATANDDAALGFAPGSATGLMVKDGAGFYKMMTGQELGDITYEELGIVGRRFTDMLENSGYDPKDSFTMLREGARITPISDQEAEVSVSAEAQQEEEPGFSKAVLSVVNNPWLAGDGVMKAFATMPSFAVGGEMISKDAVKRGSMAIKAATEQLTGEGGLVTSIVDDIANGTAPVAGMEGLNDALVGLLIHGVEGNFGPDEETVLRTMNDPSVDNVAATIYQTAISRESKSDPDSWERGRAFAGSVWHNVGIPMLKAAMEDRMPSSESFDDQKDYEAALDKWRENMAAVKAMENYVPGYGDPAFVEVPYADISEASKVALYDIVRNAAGAGVQLEGGGGTSSYSLTTGSRVEDARIIYKWLTKLEPLFFSGENTDESLDKLVDEVLDYDGAPKVTDAVRRRLKAIGHKDFAIGDLMQPGAGIIVPLGDGFTLADGPTVAEFYKNLRNKTGGAGMSDEKVRVERNITALYGQGASAEKLDAKELGDLYETFAWLEGNMTGGEEAGTYLKKRMEWFGGGKGVGMPGAGKPREDYGLTRTKYVNDYGNRRLNGLMSLLPYSERLRPGYAGDRDAWKYAYARLAMWGLGEEAYNALSGFQQDELRGVNNLVYGAVEEKKKRIARTYGLDVDLAEHPELQERMRDDVLRVLKDSGVFNRRDVRKPRLAVKRPSSLYEEAFTAELKDAIRTADLSGLKKSSVRKIGIMLSEMDSSPRPTGFIKIAVPERMAEDMARVLAASVGIDISGEELLRKLSGSPSLRKVLREKLSN